MPAADSAPGADADLTLRAWSRQYVRIALDRCAGNKRRACDVLHISYRTLKSYLDFEGGPAPATVRAEEPARARRCG